MNRLLFWLINAFGLLAVAGCLYLGRWVLWDTLVCFAFMFTAASAVTLVHNRISTQELTTTTLHIIDSVHSLPEIYHTVMVNNSLLEQLCPAPAPSPPRVKKAFKQFSTLHWKTMSQTGWTLFKFMQPACMLLAVHETVFRVVMPQDVDKPDSLHIVVGIVLMTLGAVWDHLSLANRNDGHDVPHADTDDAHKSRAIAVYALVVRLALACYMSHIVSRQLGSDVDDHSCAHYAGCIMHVLCIQLLGCLGVILLMIYHIGMERSTQSMQQLDETFQAWLSKTRSPSIVKFMQDTGDMFQLQKTLYTLFFVRNFGGEDENAPLAVRTFFTLDSKDFESQTKDRPNARLPTRDPESRRKAAVCVDPHDVRAFSDGVT